MYVNKASKYNKRTRTEVLKKVIAYKGEHPCVDCGEKDPIVLTFDHVRGEKRMDVAAMLHGNYKWESILIEIAKCEVRCANCHMRKTAKQFGWYAKITPV